MEGTSWADQWDYSNSDPVSRKGGSSGTITKSSGGGTPSTTAKYKEKVGQGLQKTKAAASVGLKKLKHGTSSGLYWVKDKYRKATHKH